MSFFKSLTQRDKEPSLTLPISKITDLILGQGYWDSVLIDEELAEAILIVTKNEKFCYIEMPDEFNLLTQPKLWRLGKWQDAHETFMRQKRWSDRQRSLRNIQDYNVKIVAKVLVRDYYKTEENAKDTALGLVSRNKLQQIKALGVEKLVTDEKEIP